MKRGNIRGGWLVTEHSLAWILPVSKAGRSVTGWRPTRPVQGSAPPGATQRAGIARQSHGHPLPQLLSTQLRALRARLHKAGAPLQPLQVNWCSLLLESGGQAVPRRQKAFCGVLVNLQAQTPRQGVGCGLNGGRSLQDPPCLEHPQISLVRPQLGLGWSLQRLAARWGRLVEVRTPPGGHPRRGHGK